MTRYIVKEFAQGRCIKKAVITIENGLHPKRVRSECPLSQFPSGSRIFYESNGQEVGLIYRHKDGSMRVRWHRL